MYKVILALMLLGFIFVMVVTPAESQILGYEIKSLYIRNFIEFGIFIWGITTGGMLYAINEEKRKNATTTTAYGG